MSAKHSLLDSRYLQEIYGDDQSFLRIIFETFLEDSLITWEKIYKAIEDSHFKQVEELIHQIKPSFAIVGLTQLYSKVKDFENLVKSNANKAVLLEKFQALNEEVKQAKIDIEEELNHIQSE